MMSLRSVIPAVALGTILIGSAQAQTYTTIPMGGGSYSTTGPNGIYTTMPLGGGWSSTIGPNGYSATTMPLGGGWSTTTVISRPPIQMPFQLHLPYSDQD